MATEVEGSSRWNVEALTLIATVALPVVTSFFYPALPNRIRITLGVIMGVAVLLALAWWMARSLRHEIRTSTAILKDLLTDYATDEGSGTLFKGALRNVSLRVATIHRVVDTLVAALPYEERNRVLEEAGYEVGRSWGRDFKVECRRTGMEHGALADSLELWSRYDATAGMGRFEFALSQSGHGSVILRNGFLSEEDSRSVLDYFFVGYLRGTLEELLGHGCDVAMESESAHAHDETTFRITPARYADLR